MFINFLIEVDKEQVKIILCKKLSHQLQLMIITYYLRKHKGLFYNFIWEHAYSSFWGFQLLKSNRTYLFWTNYVLCSFVSTISFNTFCIQTSAFKNKTMFIMVSSFLFAYQMRLLFKLMIRYNLIMVKSPISIIKLKSSNVAVEFMSE